MGQAALVERLNIRLSDTERALSSFAVFRMVAPIKALAMETVGKTNEIHAIYSKESPTAMSNARMRAYLVSHAAEDLERVAQIFAAHGYPICELRSNDQYVYVFVAK